MARMWSQLTVAALCVLLAGCAQASDLAGTRFALQATGGTPAVVDGAVRTLPQGGGQLTVSISGVFKPAARRLMARVTDIDHVSIVLTPLPGGAERTQILDKAALLAGTTSVTFAGLPLGSYRYDVKAFDATGQVLGGVQAVAVVGNTPAIVTAQVVLSPTVVAAPPPPNTGGGATGSAPTGSLGLGLDLQDGVDLWATRTLQTIQTTVLVNRVYADHGILWLLDNDPLGARIERFGALGISLGVAELANPLNGHLAFDETGTAWVPAGWSGILRYQPNGQALSTVLPGQNVSGVTALSAGGMAVTCIGQPTISKISTTGTPTVLETVSVPGADGLAAVKVDGHGRYWALGGDGDKVYVVSAAGMLLATATLPTDFAAWELILDSQDHAWLTGYGNRLLEIGADGTLLKNIDLGYQGVYPRFDANGDLWLLLMDVAPHRAEGSETNALAHFDANGTLIGRYATPPTYMPTSFEFAGNNEFWIGSWDATTNRHSIVRIGL